MDSSRGCIGICCVSTPARKGPTWSHVPWTAGQGFFLFLFCTYVFYNLPVSGIGKTEMKHNKFETNMLTAAASQDQSQKPQQEYVFSNLPVSGILGQTEMKHTKFKTNKLTTAAWTKAENHKASKKGFMWGGSDGVDHVGREVLQHGVANRGSRIHAFFLFYRSTDQPVVLVFNCRGVGMFLDRSWPIRGGAAVIYMPLIPI